MLVLFGCDNDSNDPNEDEVVDFNIIGVYSLINVNNIETKMTFTDDFKFRVNRENLNQVNGNWSVKGNEIILTVVEPGINVPSETYEIKEVSEGIEFKLLGNNSTSLLLVRLSFIGNSFILKHLNEEAIKEKIVDIKMISSCSGSVSIITENNELFVYGANYHFQLGTGNRIHVRNMNIIEGNNWKYTAIGALNMIGLNNDGSLWGTGLRKLGAFGDGLDLNTYYESFTNLNLGNDWAMIYGNSHRMYLGIKNDNSFWVWGYHSINLHKDHYFGSFYNELTMEDGWIPFNIGYLYNIKKVSLGYEHIIVLLNDGTLWGYGNNNSGQLGLNKAPYGDGYEKVFVKIGNDNDWKDIDCGHHYSVGIKNDGSLWMWGRIDINTNANGALITNNNKYIAPTRIGNDNDWNIVSCNENTTLLIKNNGSLWGFGNNYYAQLGINTSGVNGIEEPVRIGNDNNWKNVYASKSAMGYNLAVKNDGSLWNWGINGLFDDIKVPTRKIISE